MSSNSPRKLSDFGSLEDSIQTSRAASSTVSPAGKRGGKKNQSPEAGLGRSSGPSSKARGSIGKYREGNAASSIVNAYAVRSDPTCRPKKRAPHALSKRTSRTSSPHHSGRNSANRKEAQKSSGHEGAMGNRKRTGPTRSPRRCSRIIVTNVALHVTQSDLEEIFETAGDLVSVRCGEDMVGNVPRVWAEVVFSTGQAGLDAVERYKNVPLDLVPLRITLKSGTTSEMELHNAWMQSDCYYRW